MSCKCYTAKAEIYVISQVEFRRRVKSEESLLHFSEKNQAKKIYREKLSKTIREIKLRNYEHRKTVKRLSMIETEIEPQVLISTKLNMTSRSNHSSLFKRLNIKDIDLSQMKTPISTKLSNTTFENSTFGSYVSQSFFCNSSLVSPLSPTSEIGSKSSIMMTLRNNPIRPKKLAETSSEKSFKSRLIHKKLMDCSILGAKRSRLNLMHI